MNSKQDIESLFKERFNDLNIEPSATSWAKLNKKLRVKSFMRFSFKTVNIYNTTAAASVITVLSIIGINNQQKENVITNENFAEVVDEQKQVIIEAEVERNEIEKIEVVEKVEKTIERDLLSAMFTTSETKGCVPLEVTFINSSEAESYLWDFGDGATSTLKVPSHLYTTPGKYSARLKITDKNNKSYFHNQSILVYDKPEALFSINAKGSKFDEKKVTFCNDSKDATSYLWLFGDNKTNNDKNAEHIYEELGTYDVTLIAENKHGCADSVSTKVGFLADNCRIEFPTVFTPVRKESGNIEVELFHPSSRGVDKYHLVILNQFDNVVFETKDITTGWDGYYKGKIVPAGNYSWKVNGKFINGQSFENQGNIRLKVKKIEVYDQY